MKKYEIKKHNDFKFVVYLEKSIVSRIQEWLIKQPEVLFSHEADGFILVDLTPRCEKKDIEEFFSRLEGESQK